MSRAGRDAEYDAWLSQLTFSELERRLRALGVTKVVLKRLSPAQDNSQNQFYWQGRLNENPLPLGPFEEFDSIYKGVAQKGYKARMNLVWLTPAGTNPAPLAQLIYYPRYPEARLGSLLRRTEHAPRSVIASRAVSVAGRLMLLGIAGSQVVAVALPPWSPAATRLVTLFGTGPFASWALAPQATVISAADLLSELRGVYDLRPVASCKLNQGVVIASTDPNAPGMTLELTMGVRPNARDGPDFHGWELKAHSDHRITLMTPAPTSGSVVTDAPADFMRKFGWPNRSGTRWDFNGAHRATQAPGGKATTRMVVTASEVQLVHKTSGEVAMSWQIADLLTHWAKKHANAAYVRRSGSIANGFDFGPHVQLGEGVDWKWVRQALDNGTIAVDPAYNMATGGRRMTRERAQFRCYGYELGALYPSVTVHDLRHSTPSRQLAHANLKAEGIILPHWIEP